MPSPRTCGWWADVLTRTVPHLDLAQIAASGQCFTWERRADGGWRIPAGEHCLWARQEGMELNLSCSQEEFDGFWSHYFDLETDYGGLKAALDPADRYLCAAAAHGGGIRVLRQDFWEVLVSFLISQNNNITRITRSMTLLRERYGRDCGGFRAFPRPEDLAGATEGDFQALGLGYRAKYLVRLSEKLSGGRLAEWEEELSRCSNEEAERALMGLYGVGKKVADCICLFGLHRADFFPVDTHIRQIFAQHYPQGFPYERYRGYLGIIQQYLFYYDLSLAGGRKKKKP